MTGERYWNGTDVAEKGWLPSPVPESQRHAAQRALADIEQELRPADRAWIAGRIVTLLAHYWMPEMNERLQEAVGRDWADVLGQMPRHAIEAACKAYLSSNTRARPTPGQILELAQEAVGERFTQRDRLRQCLECDMRKPKPAARPDYRYQVAIGIMTQEDADRHMERWEREHGGS